MTDGHPQQGNGASRWCLSRFHVGGDLQRVAAQPGLDFSVAAEELFGGAEMGGDGLRLLVEYRVQLFSNVKAVADRHGPSAVPPQAPRSAAI